ncbi:MAG: hypothetical protein ACI976_000674 [Aureispira sp.]|jgi:hypothetical protein
MKDTEKLLKEELSKHFDGQSQQSCPNIKKPIK